jgi:hypothetical protein
LSTLPPPTYTVLNFIPLIIQNRSTSSFPLLVSLPINTLLLCPSVISELHEKLFSFTTAGRYVHFKYMSFPFALIGPFNEKVREVREEEEKK